MWRNPPDHSHKITKICRLRFKVFTISNIDVCCYLTKFSWTYLCIAEWYASNCIGTIRNSAKKHTRTFKRRRAEYYILKKLGLWASLTTTDSASTKGHFHHFWKASFWRNASYKFCAYHIWKYNFSRLFCDASHFRATPSHHRLHKLSRIYTSSVPCAIGTQNATFVYVYRSKNWSGHLRKIAVHLFRVHNRGGLLLNASASLSIFHRSVVVEMTVHLHYSFLCKRSFL